MRLPSQAQPVIRSGRPTSGASAGGEIRAANPANCNGIPNNIVGTCNFPDGPSGGYNCTACCAMRQAISWQGGGFAVAC
jgi:hypothetical protein